MFRDDYRFIRCLFRNLHCHKLVKSDIIICFVFLFLPECRECDSLLLCSE